MSVNKRHLLLGISAVLLVLVGAFVRHAVRHRVTSAVLENSSNRVAAHRKTRIRRAFVEGETFFQITNLGSADIEFTPGPCSVVAEGDSALVTSLNVDYDTDGITLYLDTERNADLQHYNKFRSGLKVHVSCPSLRIIANCGAGTFRSHGLIRTPSLHVGTISDGNVTMDSVVVDDGDFRYESGTAANAEFTYIAARNVYLLNYGQGTLTAPAVQASARATLDLSSRAVTRATLHTPWVGVSAIGQSNGTLTVVTDTLWASAQEHSKITFRGRAAQQQLKCGREAKITTAELHQ